MKVNWVLNEIWTTMKVLVTGNSVQNVPSILCDMTVTMLAISSLGQMGKFLLIKKI